MHSQEDFCAERQAPYTRASKNEAADICHQADRDRSSAIFAPCKDVPRCGDPTAGLQEWRTILAEIRVADTCHRISVEGVRAPCRKRRPASPAQSRPARMVRSTVQHGLADDAAISAHIDVLNDLHRIHYSRYPQQRSALVPDASIIADGTVDHLIFAFTQSINPR